ncbi:MAG: DUF1491 family protein [Pseudomonadota bacterium]
MQLKSEVWVHAFLRSSAGAGGMPVVVHHGDNDAGAIYIKLFEPPNLADVFGPAPMGLSDTPQDRVFVRQLGAELVPEPDADTFLSQQLEFDRDLWIVEVRRKPGLIALEPWMAN